VHLIFYTVSYIFSTAIEQFHACPELGLKNCSVKYLSKSFLYSVFS
jgi:hypothetical protein